MIGMRTLCTDEILKLNTHVKKKVKYIVQHY